MLLAQKSVLLVEDDPQVRLLFKKVLKLGGFRVTEAANGHLALQCLAQASFDLIVTDIEMPGAGGSQLIAALQGQESRIPILVVSGRPGLAPRGYPVLAKPLSPAELLQMVRNLCDQAPCQAMPTDRS